MAYLNGTHMPKVMNLKTLGVKFLSAALAVGSGLPVGPEGPMVHIGATIASGMSQGHSTTLGWDSGLLKRFQNPKDKRDFVTAGAAVGVATAFSAPIGGLLFVFEEVASFWQQALGWQIFFACMLAVLTADTLRSAVSAVRDGTFGLFDKEASTVFFEVQTQLTNHVFAVLPAAVCGLVSGLMAIFFTFINLRVTRLRAELLRTKFQKMMEPCVLIVLFVTLGTLLPLFFPCTPTQCVVIQGESTPVCPEGTPPRIQRIVEDTIELYTCSPAAATSDIPPDWDTDPAKGNITVPKAYNELATLMSVTGEDAIRHLLSRGTHKEFGYAAILCMLVFYFLGAAVTAGSAISSGTFVPMLLIGACIGRLIGLVTVNIAAAHGAGSEGAPPGVFLPPSPWAWIDPGAFALIGAGAFMGGVTRMTLALAVIIMEMSNDVRILLPAMVAIMLAKWVADAASHSLYHGLLEVKCVPFLPKELPIADVSLDLLEVRYVMAAPVVTLREKMRLGEVRDVLRSTRHNGFPVVRPSSLSSSNGENGGGGDGGNTTATNNNINSYKRDLSKEYGGTNASSPYAAAAEQQDVYLGFSSDNNDGVFIGIAARDHLLRLLLEAVRRGTAQHLELTYPDLNHHHIDPSILAKEEEQQLAVLEGRPPTPQHFPAAPALWDETLDLTPYINMAAYRVPESFSVERAYVLFSTMGLRHLVVVDENNRVRGIVTRKDLLGYRLDEAVMRARTGAPGAAELLSPIEADRGDLSLA
jgi:H+/Cl- antiporter ClcA